MASLPDRGDVQAVERHAEEVAHHPAFRAIARAGFVMTGLVHLAIGWIALQLALGNSAQDADQSGALRTIAALPGGNILLWIGGLVMVALTVWHLVDAWFGAKWRKDPKKRISHIVKTLGKAIVYGALAFTSLRFAAGAGSDSGEQTSQLTAGLMGQPAGRAVVLVVGLVVVGIGIYHVYAGVTRRFENDLRGAGDRRIGAVIRVTGVVGYIAKGLALVGVGALFGWAAIGADPNKATGMDGALKTMAGLPTGSVLLAVVGAGLILYGIYSMMRSRYEIM